MEEEGNFLLTLPTMSGKKTMSKMQWKSDFDWNLYSSSYLWTTTLYSLSSIVQQRRELSLPLSIMRVEKKYSYSTDGEAQAAYYVPNKPVHNGWVLGVKLLPLPILYTQGLLHPLLKLGKTPPLSPFLCTGLVPNITFCWIYLLWPMPVNRFETIR